jgi:hypothetical protein
MAVLKHTVVVCTLIHPAEKLNTAFPKHLQICCGLKHSSLKFHCASLLLQFIVTTYNQSVVSLAHTPILSAHTKRKELTLIFSLIEKRCLAMFNSNTCLSKTSGLICTLILPSLAGSSTSRPAQRLSYH